MRQVLFLFCFLAAAAWAEGTAQPEAASGFAPRPAAVGRHFMVVTANPHATDAAADILKVGGSALDAAIAAQMVLNLVEPQASGIGGGGFLLYHDAAQKRLRAYDGRETAPAAAQGGRFLDTAGRAVSFREAAVGGRAVGVPGLLAMLELAHRNHGKLPWRQLFEPAIRLAEHGYPLSPRLHKLLAAENDLRSEPMARQLYFDEGGEPKAVGSPITNRALARTLHAIANGGAAVFYRGAVARDMVAAVRGHARNPGDLAETDLEGYRAREREPLCYTRLHGRRVCGMPPPSSGGLAVLQMLAFLEGADLAAEPPLSERSVHWFSEAGRLAFADRRRYLADPDFVAVPVRELLDPAYLARRGELLREDRSLGEASAGDLPLAQALGDGDTLELPSTTHLSIVDSMGNALAMTSSIEHVFGSRIMVRGFLLNNQLTDFSFRPTEKDLPVANRVEAGKRPLSSMTPTLVYDPDGSVSALVGSPGGTQIINYVAKTLWAIFAWDLPPRQALELPHFGSRNGPTELEKDTPASILKAALEQRGHKVAIHDMTSGLSVILRRGEEWIGAADPRREGTARGE
jgi:gamma-glutamyltranspeptidase/glutathione hydrolase